MADGTITFSTALDNKELESQLNSLTKKINRLEDKIAQKQSERLPMATQAEQLGVELDSAKAKLFEMKNAATGAFSSESIKEQQTHVSGLQSEWNSVQGKVEKYDADIQKAAIELDRNKEKAGDVAQQLSKAKNNSNKMSGAIDKANKNLDIFKKRLAAVVRSALIFTVITQALTKFRDWIDKVIKVNPQARAAIAKLKGALLTLAQPLVNVIIPAFIWLVNVLTKILTVIARFTSMLAGTTVAASAAAAEALNKQTSALNKTGKAAKKASRSLAAFDEINKLDDNSDSNSGSDSIAPDFSGIGNANWLKDRLGEAADLVTAGLMLGGLALVALGAATGNLVVVLAGLALLAAGVVVGNDTGVLQSWADTLGLNSVEEFVVAGLILGGIAIVAIGAAMGNILMVIAGLALIGATIMYVEKSGMLNDWAGTLGLSQAANFITAALLIGGIALVAIGAAMKNILMVIAGLGLIGAGIYIGTTSGTLQKWWETLMLPEVATWVTAGLLLGGIALIAIGACTGNVLMLLGGIALLGAAAVFGTKSGTFANWQDVLGLPQVARWVTTGLLLAGIGFVVLGIVLKNIAMVIGGVALLGTGVAFGAESGTFANWWESLGLSQAAGWVTAGLLIGGIALVVFGIASANILLVVAGLAMLGAGITVGVKSGTFSNWIDTIVKGLSDGWSSIKSWWHSTVAPVFTVAFWKNIFSCIGEAFDSVWDAIKHGAEMAWYGIKVGVISLANFVINAINVMIKGVLAPFNLLIGALNKIPGVNIPTLSLSIPDIALPPVPALAAGAVIPPNQQFLAMLGDQKSGTNIEAPESLIRRIVREESANGGGDTVVNNVLKLDGRTVYKNQQRIKRLTGKSLVEEGAYS